MEERWRRRREAARRNAIPLLILLGALCGPACAIRLRAGSAGPGTILDSAITGGYVGLGAGVLLEAVLSLAGLRARRTPEEKSVPARR